MMDRTYVYNGPDGGFFKKGKYYIVGRITDVDYVAIESNLWVHSQYDARIFSVEELKYFIQL